MSWVGQERARHAAIGVAVLVGFAVLVVRCAWVSDDAFITLRTVDNFLSGYGLRWNVVERVQSYTHPLWMAMLVVPHALTGEPYYGTLALSFGVSGLAFGLLWFRVAKSTSGALLACVPLLGSKAFIDFCTSGLENPLTHLMLAGLALSVGVGARPTDVGRTAGIVFGSALVRPDLIVLFGPALLAHLAIAGVTRRHLAAAALGAVPLVAWELFSLVYYGSLVPNTAYAKLGAGIGRGELVAQGLTYLRYTQRFDPLTAVVIGAGLVALAARRTRESLALLAGALAYTGFIVWIGGDFMGGRLLTPVLFTAAIGLAWTALDLRVGAALALAAFAFGATNPKAPIWSGVSYARPLAWHGVTDERGFYHRGAGLLGTRNPVSHSFARQGREARERGPHTADRATIGFYGYYAGPDVHVIDRLGLADPLIARLPARYDPTWRIGHFRREVPAGYDPRLDAPPDDPELARLYARVRSLVRGPLTDPGRIATALDLQLRGPSIDPWDLRFPHLDPVDPELLPREIGEGGARVAIAPPRPVTPDVNVAVGERWRALYVRDRQVLAEHTFEGGRGPVSLPPSPGEVDALLLYPVVRDGGLRLLGVDLGVPTR